MNAISLVYDSHLTELAQNPYKIYQFYRSLNPILPGITPNSNGHVTWYVFGYTQTRLSLSSPHFGRVKPLLAGQPPATGSQGPLSDLIGGFDKDWMVFTDPPHHTRLKGLVGQVFTADFLEMANVIIEEETASLLKDLLLKKQFNLISELAELLPVRVMARLLGLEEKDLEIFCGHALTLLAASHQRRNKIDSFVYASRARLALMTLLKSLVSQRTENPTADLVSRLVLARNGETKLSQQEIVSNCLHLLVSGYGVAVNLIGNAVFTLLKYPDQLEILQSDPSLCSQAIDEVLRFESPIQMVDRWVQADSEIDGTSLRRGERVYLVLGAANRDPAAFPEPDTLDITRKNQRQLAFGGGIHSCLGRHLAQSLGKAVIQTLLPYMACCLKLAGPTPVWKGAPFFRGLSRLDITNLTNL
jgi:cytochrome P450